MNERQIAERGLHAACEALANQVRASCTHIAQLADLLPDAGAVHLFAAAAAMLDRVRVELAAALYGGPDVN